MPDSAEALALALQYSRAGYLPQAEQIYRQILQTDSANVDALAYLGGVYMAQGRFLEAAVAFQQVIQIRPDFAEMYNELGIAFAQQGKAEEALLSFQRALELRRHYPQAHNNLGILLGQHGKLDEAVAHYTRALLLRPDYAEAHNNLGIIFARQKKESEAVASYREALRLKPHYAEAHNNLGAALAAQGQPEAARASFQRAVQLKSDYAEAYYNLGVVYLREAAPNDAATCFQQALQLRPGYAEAHKDLALALLMQGNFEQGWSEYEWRWRCSEVPCLPFHQPRWDGSPLAGRTILLHVEQGLGDTLQFIRYAPLVRQRGGSVLVLCQPSLLSVLASCPGIDQLLPQGAALPDFAVHAPLLSLPGIFRTDLTTIPAQVPYLSADPALVEQSRRKLSALDSRPTRVPMAGEEGIRRGFNVGIAWQGSPTHSGDRQRSVPLWAFTPLAELPGVRLFSLQVGPGAEQLHESGAHFPVTDLSSHFDPASFQDAGAAVAALDLIITVDSALAHLAGALGKPVWVLLPYAPDWRWLRERQDSPWYPTMRLFRQPRPGDWNAVFHQVADALARQLSDEATIQERGCVVGERTHLPGGAATLALGLEYQRAGYPSQAEQIYQQVLHHDGANADALACLGELYMAQGRAAEAAGVFQQMLRLRPHVAEVYLNLGVILAQQGKIDEAVASFQQALQLRPDYPEAHNNLGIVLVHQERLEEAISHYAQALQLRPDYAEAHNNLGIARARQKKLGEAVASYQEALRLKPDYAEAHNNLGAALEALGQVEGALASYGQAVRLKPDYVEAHNNLGASYDTLRHLEEALACYDEAVRLKPEYAEAHRNRALLWLLLGDFERGWPEYEWRWHCQGVALPSFRQPLWDGGPLQGRTILLHAEQGLGDTLHFIRYAPLVQQRGGRVLVQGQPLLLSLLARCPGIDQLLPQGAALPDFAVHAPLLSLPGIFHTDLTTIPAPVPYLSADPTLVQHWQKELDALSSQEAGDSPRSWGRPPACQPCRQAEGLPHEQRMRSLNVGIAWQGNPKHRRDPQRSLSLARFESLAQVPGVRLYSLQVGPGAEQLRELGDRFPVIDLGSRFDSTSFEDATALVTVLDLIISVDSAIAHLAGALAVPVWVLLPFAADWRWLLGREDSPWYLTMRLFRQTEPGDWDGVFDRLAAVLVSRSGPIS
jgi:Flp pilus assembly protein TadD